MGAYMGRSPHHAHNVALVLNIKSGLVSPQFHVSFDPEFDTVSSNSGEPQWMIKAGMIKGSINTKKAKRSRDTPGTRDAKANESSKKKQMAPAKDNKSESIYVTMPAQEEQNDPVIQTDKS